MNGSREDPASVPTADPRVPVRSTVVVVDDNAANVALLEQLLTGAGVGEIHGFTDPRLALTRLAEIDADLLLVDLHMPDIDGLALMDAARAASREHDFLPVLVLTADTTGGTRERALAAGATDFLTKPFDRTEVLLRVRNLLETRALYRQVQRHNDELQATIEEQTAAERMAAAAHERLARRVDRVLAGGVMSMVFQPVADLATAEIVGAEALARFRGEPRQPPNAWFADAAAVGRGPELELAAVAAAVAEIHRLPAAAFLSVNVSPATASMPELADILGDAPRERVVLELTEHARVDDYDLLLRALRDLRDGGVRLAVDDTGAGYAGFQHLVRLSPDIVKLDTTLTRGIDADPVRRALATALVSFAAEIGATIIAEGIEIAGELSVLHRLGIRWGQGYQLAHPGPLPLPALRLATLHPDAN